MGRLAYFQAAREPDFPLLLDLGSNSKYDKSKNATLRFIKSPRVAFITNI
jgi:hypothetical protein